MKKAFVYVMITTFIILTMGAFTFAQQGSEVFSVQKVELEEGWNLVSYGAEATENIISSSEVQLSDIRAIYGFFPKAQEYVLMHPSTQYEYDNKIDNLEQQTSIDDDILYYNAAWIYSNKKGEIVFKYGHIQNPTPLSFDAIPLYKGWNFFSISEDDLINVDFPLWRGNCEIEKIHTWNPLANSWNSLDAQNDDFEPYDFGYGAAIKVSQDCNLGINYDWNGEIPSPPTLN